MLTRQQLQLWLMKTDCCFTAEPAGPQITVVIMVNQQFSYREIKSFTVNLEVQWPSPHKTIYLLQGVTKRTVNCCFIPTWSLTSLVLWTERAFDDLHKHLWKKRLVFSGRTPSPEQKLLTCTDSLTQQQVKVSSTAYRNAGAVTNGTNECFLGKFTLKI